MICLKIKQRDIQDWEQEHTKENQKYSWNIKIFSRPLGLFADSSLYETNKKLEGVMIGFRIQNAISDINL